jgi:cytochrome c1
MLENNAENLARWLRDPAAVKPGMGRLKGSGAAMGMPNVGLTEDEIAGLVAYLETLR